MGSLSKREQDNIVVQLAVSIETLSGEEFDELHDQLDDDHQMEVRADIRAFADNAVGDEHWDSDD